MDLFFVTLQCVGTMLLYAIPGFLCIKTKLMKPEQISVLSTLLIYVVSPAMNLDSFINGNFEKKDIGTCLLFFVCGMVIQLTVLMISFLVLRKKYADVRKKILTLATVLGNCGFMGIPILRAVLPQYPLAIPLAMFYSLGMNVLLYTMGFFIITGEKRFVSFRRLLLNPTTISVAAGFSVFILSSTTSFQTPEMFVKAFSVLGAMSTPLCLLVIGMRLATVRVRQLLLEPVVYYAIAVKQILVPLVVFTILRWIPLDVDFRNVLFVMTCVPVASMILMACEVLGEGQKEAASTVLISTISSIFTIPLMMLLIA